MLKLPEQMREAKERQGGGGGEDRLGYRAILLPGKLHARWITLPALQETDKVFRLGATGSGELFASSKYIDSIFFLPNVNFLLQYLKDCK